MNIMKVGMLVSVIMLNCSFFVVVVELFLFIIIDSMVIVGNVFVIVVILRNLVF